MKRGVESWKSKTNVAITIFSFCILYGSVSFSQSFVKTYNDLTSPYYGLNVLPTISNETAVLGWYYGTGGYAFTTLVDSLGNRIVTKTGYPRYVNENISSLTKFSSGYVFFNSEGPGNMLENNVQSLIFNSEMLNIDTVNIFYSALYSYTTNLNLYSINNNALIMTCTGWTRSPSHITNLYSETFISRYDTNGRRIWNNYFSPSDTDQIYYSIITPDSGIAVIGMITDSTQVKKYYWNGNLLWNAKLPNFTNTASQLIALKSNVLACGTILDINTHKNQLAVAVLNSNGSILNQSKYIINLDTADATIIGVGLENDSTALINFIFSSSTLRYFIAINYKGDSASSFIIPYFTASAFDNGNVLCASDTNNTIMVREYDSKANLIYNYTYKPYDSLNVCYDIKPLPFPGRFVLTGSSNNNLLIIRQDTGSIATGINNIEKKSEVNVFPNPTKNQITIQFAGKQNFVSTIQFYDIKGREVLTQKLNQATTTIDCSGLRDGAYLYKITDENGKVVKADKIVVER